MGNCCGKPDPDVFATPGRRLDSAPGPARGTIPGAPAHKPPKSQPAPAPRTVGGPAHTLGGGSWTSGGAAEDARRKAAAAAEVSFVPRQTGKPGRDTQRTDSHAAPGPRAVEQWR